MDETTTPVTPVTETVVPTPEVATPDAVVAPETPEVK